MCVAVVVVVVVVLIVVVFVSVVVVVAVVVAVVVTDVCKMQSLHMLKYIIFILFSYIYKVKYG